MKKFYTENTFGIRKTTPQSGSGLFAVYVLGTVFWKKNSIAHLHNQYKNIVILCEKNISYAKYIDLS